MGSLAGPAKLSFHLSLSLFLQSSPVKVTHAQQTHHWYGEQGLRFLELEYRQAVPYRFKQPAW